MAIFYTYDDGNRLEDVMRDVITITPTKTPFMSSIRKTKAYNTLHQWPSDALTVRQDNAVIEGGAFTVHTMAAPSRLVNLTQIFDSVMDVTSTENWVKGAGYDNQYAYQMSKAVKEIGTDIETALLKGTIASGTGTLARRLAGVIQWITTNATAVASGTVLTESFFNGMHDNCWNQGGNPDECYVGSMLKRVISSFSQASTREVDATDKKLVLSVSVYENDFGVVKTILSYDVNNAANDCTVLLLENAMWRMAVGEEVHELPASEVAQTKHAKMGVLRGELTLEALAQAANAKATGFVKAFGV